MTHTTHELWLTVEDVAGLLDTTPTTVRRWIVTGHLPGRKIGAMFRISSTELGDYLDRDIFRDDAGTVRTIRRTNTRRYPAPTLAPPITAEEVGA